LPAAEIECIFRPHDAIFGHTYNSVYSTAVVLWAFLCQVLADGKMRSCAAAVARACNFLIVVGKNPPSTDTGEYCNARKKLDEKALHDLLVEAAGKIEHVAPDDWLWYGRHAKLVDGFTATMPGTPENQKEYPQQKSQKPGLGFPIIRACLIVSLATACVLDAAFGPYSGKQTGEPALFRERLDAFQPGDVPVFGRYCSSYMMLALLMLRDVDVCARLHQRRPSDFRRGKRFGKYDRLDACRPEQILGPCDRRIVWLSVERGTGHPPDRANVEPGPSALQDAGDGTQGILDDAVGLQSDPADHLHRGHRARQNAAMHQFHPNVRDDSGGVVDFVIGRIRTDGHSDSACPDRLAGSAGPPRPNRTTRAEATSPPPSARAPASAETQATPETHNSMR